MSSKQIVHMAVKIFFVFLPCHHMAGPSNGENRTLTWPENETSLQSNYGSSSSSNGLPTYENLPEPLQQLSSSSRIVGPYFESNQTSNIVSARPGQIVILDCVVVLLQGRTVSWLRRWNESMQLLTVGNQTYSSDSKLNLRFRYPNNWRLEIRQVSKRDEGEYQCQLSNHPPKTLVFHLRIIAPELVILDENEHLILERHYKVDSFLLLTCRASYLDDTVDKLVWVKGSQTLPGVESRIKVKEWKNQTIGEASVILSILSVRQGDSGNYTCRASTSQATVVVHVINEKLPAAVQHENNSAHSLRKCHQDVYVVISLTFILAKIFHRILSCTL